MPDSPTTPSKPDRPAYSITVSDYGDRVAWGLLRDDKPVTGGSVSLDHFNLDTAFSLAWTEANLERRTREAAR